MTSAGTTPSLNAAILAVPGVDVVQVAHDPIQHAVAIAYLGRAPESDVLRAAHDLGSWCTNVVSVVNYGDLGVEPWPWELAAFRGIEETPS